MRGQLAAMKQAETDIWISKIQSIDTSHLRELRQIALLTLFVWSIATIASALSHYYLISPLLTWFAWYFPDVQLVNFDVTSPFSLLISLSMVTGFLVTLPWLCFFLWRFISPGLYEHERSFLRFSLVLLLCSTVILQIFSLGIVVPACLRFFIQFNQKYFGASIDIFSLISFIVTIQKGFLLCSLLPSVLAICLRLRLISLYTLEKWRGHFYILAFIVAMFLTPPDVISQTLMALSLIALFEITLYILQKKFSAVFV